MPIPWRPRIETRRRNVDASGIQVDNNVYLGGAGPFPNRDAQSIIDASPAGVELKIEDRTATLKLNLPPAVLEGKHALITSKLIGKVPLAEMFMEHPDGTPLDVTADYFGKPIDPARVVPGPFQKIRPGENRFRVWPKQTP